VTAINTLRGSDRQFDVIKEIVNIGVGQAAASLNSLVDSHIELSLPEIRIMDYRELQADNSGLLSAELSYVQLPFRGPFSGTAMLAFPTDGAVKLVSTLTGEDINSSSLDAVMAGTLSEVGNIVINGVIGSISNLLNQPLDFSLPEYSEGNLAELLETKYCDEEITAVMAYITFSIASLSITGNIVLLFEFRSFGNFISAVDMLIAANETRD
jgi:chemotaxis protein CheC